MKRMNLMIDEEALKGAMRELGETTASGTVNKALAEMARKLTLQRLFKEVKGTGWDGDLAEMRRTRTFDDVSAPQPKRKRVAAKTVSAPRQKATRAKRRSR